jgi:hypothetical protein
MEDRGIDGSMGSEWILGTLAGRGCGRIRLAQDRDRCCACCGEPLGSCTTELVIVFGCLKFSSVYQILISLI